MDTDRKALERAVAGALRAVIHDHGPITVERIGSAVKRIVGNLRNASGAGRPTSAAAELGRQRWAGVTKRERTAFATTAGARGGSAAWADMTAAERSAEMARRWEVRRRKRQLA